jgi:putative selenate reductase molybdopterin-binding subunit
MPEGRTIGRAERRRDGVKLATGRATFTDDVALPGLLHACVLTSPHAHAHVARVNADAARSLPGVVTVLTADDFPSPARERDSLFRDRVRFVGDRVAVVAAEEAELARHACDVIDVQYDGLPAVFDAEAVLAAPDPTLAAELRAQIGDVDRALAGADHVLTGTYRMPRVAQASIEPQITLAWLDEDHRLVVRTSSHVPFEVRRVLARRLGIPLGQIRVLAPRDGGAFGGRLGVFVEDLCAALALRTGRPVRLVQPRGEELAGPRSGHAQTVTVRSGVRKGALVALEMTVVENAGAYDEWAEPALRAAGGTLGLYRCPNVRFLGRAVETHLPPAGALRGDGATQAIFALESHIDEVAATLGEDPVAFRERHHLREGDETPLWTLLAGGDPARPRVVQSCGLGEALRLGAGAIGWGANVIRSGDGAWRRGLGVALALQSPGPLGAETTSATIDMNEDGSFVLFVGTTDMDAGGDTVLCQIAAEVLGVPTESVGVHTADTDVVPFSSGPTRSSALYVSGNAVRGAAEAVRHRIAEHGARLLGLPIESLTVRDGAVFAADGRTLTYEAIGRATLLGPEPIPVTATASHSTEDAPPPFAAVFAEVEVDVETGAVRVVKLVEAVDCGRILHPQIAEARLEGGAVQGLGYVLSEAVTFDSDGRSRIRTLQDYPMLTARDAPEILSLLVPSHEPTGPFGAKSIAEIAIHGVPAAVANAVARAIGTRLRELPLTPERVLFAISPPPPAAPD